MLDQFGEIAGVVHEITHVAGWVKGSISFNHGLRVFRKVSLDGGDVAARDRNLHVNFLLAC